MKLVGENGEQRHSLDRHNLQLGCACLVSIGRGSRNDLRGDQRLDILCGVAIGDIGDGGSDCEVMA